MEPLNPSQQRQFEQQPIVAQQYAQQQRQLDRVRRLRASTKAQRSSSAPLLPHESVTNRLRVTATIFTAVGALLWAVAIATHVQWVRLHDGTVTPVSYTWPGVASLTALGCLLLGSYAKAMAHGNRRANNIVAAVAPHDDRVDPDARSAISSGDRLTPHERTAKRDTANQGDGGVEAHVRAGGQTGKDQADVLATARELYEQGRYEESERAFVEVTHADPTWAEAYYGLGMTAVALGKSAGAGHDPGVEYFQRAVAIDPRHANALYQLGVIDERAGNVAAAVENYRHAVEADASHASGVYALNRLTARSENITTPPATRPATLPVNHGDPLGLGVPSVYQFLLEDPAPISRQTVELMNKVECECSPRYIAYVGRYAGSTLRRLLILAGALAVVTVLLDVVRSHFPSAVAVSSSAVGRVDLVLAILICLTPFVIAAAGYVQVKCTRVRIVKGRLQIEKGVFRKHLNNIDFWRVHNIDLDRRLLNRITDDGTLVFALTFSILPENYERSGRRQKRRDGVVEVCGCATGAKLAELHQDLLNLIFLLRGNPVVKGIIQ
jgi:tetratricopeptide (TPR) repeat protein